MDLTQQTDRTERIERLAYERWEARGRPWGSPDEDWIAAEAMIRAEEAPPAPEGSESSLAECRKCCCLSWPAIAIAVAAAGAVTLVWWLLRSKRR